MPLRKLLLLLIAVLALVLTLASCTMPESDYVKVSFFVDGKAYESYWVKKGDSLAEEPEVPDKEGMTGVWSITQFDELQTNLRVDAVYSSAECTITFKVDSTVISTVKVKKNSTPTAIPQVPAREGFEGAWNYTNFTNIIQDITVTAVYTPIRCTVSFMNGNDLFVTRVTDYGGAVTNIPELPSSGLNQSSKWVDENGNTPSFSNIKTDISIYARFFITMSLINSYRENDIVTYNFGNEIGEIQTGVNEGYDFYGWYYDEALTQKVNFPLTINNQSQNCQLYARWLKVSEPDDFTFLNGIVTGYTGTDTLVTIPYKYTVGEETVYVTGIGANAFVSDTITEISIPGTVTFFNARAFANCTALKKLNYPDQNKVESIGAYAFENCQALTSFEAGNYLTSISDYAFTNCTSLVDVSLGSITSIGQYAFSGITTVQNLNIPSTVTTIGVCAFQNMTNAVFTFTGGNNVVSVGERAFANCIKLTEFVAPKLQSIGNYAFINCKALASATMMSNGYLYRLFGTSSFENSYDITVSETTYYLPTSLVNLTVVPNAGGEFIVSGVLIENALLDAYYIKNVFLSGNFTTIERNAFKLNDINKVTEPVFSITVNSLGKIDTYAFLGRNDLTSIALPASLYEIGDYAFYGLARLSQVTIAANNGLTKIGKYAFAGTKWLTDYFGVASLGKIAIGFGTNYISTGGRTTLVANDLTGLSIIAPNAFEANIGLLEVNIPATITTIGTQAFKGCVGLQKIEFPINASFGDDILSGCYNLTEIKLGLTADLHKLFGQASYPNTYTVTRTEQYYIPLSLIKLTLLADTLATVQKDRYSEYSSLTAVVLGEGITQIYDGAFKNLTALTSFSIPASLLEIGVKQNEEDSYTGVFENCSNLANLNIPVLSNLKAVYSKAFYNTKLKSIQFPSTVTTIGAQAFENTKLTSVSFIQGVSPLTIGDYAFKGITTYNDGFNIVFPTNLISIGGQAFYGNTKLSGVSLNSGLLSIGAYAFASCNLRTFVLPLSVNLFDGDTCLVEGLLQNNPNLNTLTLSKGIKIADLFMGSYPANLTKVIVTGGEILDNQFQNLTSLQLVELTNITKIGSYAFDGCNNANLLSITVPASVVEIGDNAFSNCAGLTNFLIFSNSILKTVGKNVFQNDAKLKQVLFPETVENTVWDGIFNGCTSLTITNIPALVTEIGNYTFNNCAALKSINIPDNIEIIGDYAFNNCQNTLFENCNFEYLTSLGQNAFTNCTKLISFKAENIETIGANAFLGCNDMNEITIINNAPTSYISNVSLLTTVNISSKATTIESRSFASCDSLIMIFFALNDADNPISRTVLTNMLAVLADDVNNDDLNENTGIFISSEMYTALGISHSGIYSYPTIFAQSDYILDQVNMEATIIGSASASGVLYIPRRIIDNNQAYTVTSIGAGAFKNNANITSIIISSTVTQIEREAFSNCANLNDITFEAGSNLTHLGAYAFEYCVKLTTFTLPDSLLEIGEGTFYECNALNSVELSQYSRLESIAEFAFSHTAFLDNYPGLAVINGIAIGYGAIYVTNGNVATITEENLAGITQIAPYAFSGISTLTSIIIPSNIISIGNNAFDNNPNLNSAVFTGNVIIGEGAFAKCNKLASIKIGVSVDLHKLFGNTSYAQSYAVVRENKNYYIPESLINLEIFGDGRNYIASRQYKDYKKLQTVSILEGIEIIYDGAFAQNTSLLTVSIPDSLVEIGKLNQGETVYTGTFKNCVSLTEILIGENSTLHEIYPMAFSDSGLVSIELPSSLTRIGNSAFANCTALTEALLPANITIGTSVFFNCQTLRTLRIGISVNLHTVFGNTSYDRSYALYRDQSNYFIPTALKNLELIYDGISSISAGRYESYTSLEQVTIAKQITQINQNAFKNCVNLKTAILPKTATVGDNALASCYSLEFLRIGVSVNLDKVFGTAAYPNSYQISRDGTIYYIPLSFNELEITYNGVNFIANNKYSGYKSLTKITVDAGIEKIYDEAFANNDSLTSFTLPDTLTELGVMNIGASSYFGVFNNSNLLNLVTINSTSNLIKIYPYAFKGTAIQNISLPQGLTTLGNGAFENCTELVSVILPPYAVIEDNAFAKCSKLESITLGASNDLHKAFGTLNYIGSYTIVKDNNNYYIPSSLKVLELLFDGETILNGGSYRNYQSVEEIIIGNGILQIGEGTFRGCTNLKEISFAPTVVTIGNNAIADCPSIESIVIGASLDLHKVFGNDSFSGSYAILRSGVNYYVPITLNSLELIYNGLNTIAGGRYNDYISIEKLIIGAGITNIANGAFADCSNLRDVALPANCVVGNAVFANCRQMQSLELGASVSLHKLFGTVNFAGSYPVYKDGEYYYIPNTLTKLIILSGNKTNIENERYADYKGLEEIIVGEGIISIGNSAFGNNEKLALITLSSTVTTLGGNVFANCSNLESVTLNNENANAVLILLNSLNQEDKDIFNNCTVYIEESAFLALTQEIALLDLNIAVAP